MEICFRDARLSDVVQGVTAVVSEGVLVYRVFVTAEALVELGASEDPRTWLPAFHRHAVRIAERVAERPRKTADGTAIIETFGPG